MQIQHALDKNEKSEDGAQFLEATLPAGSCASCPVGSCDAQLRLWGDLSECIGCDPRTCDWTCLHPDKVGLFVDRWRQVGGFPPPSTKSLRSPTLEDLPTYVTMIQHGYNFDQPLKMPVVALPTFKAVAKRRDGTYGRRGKGYDALRQQFGLATGVRVLLISVARDRLLEAYWHSRRDFDVPHEDVPHQIAAMGVDAITVPNFSFFEDAPRTHTLWNLRRMSKVAEELSDAGVGVIPHVNALVEADWNYWVDLLIAQPQIRFIAKEFQTGLARHEAAQHAFKQLCRLQDRVGRELHPILIGGGRFASDLPQHFSQFTIVDSVPFMRTIHRQAAINSEAESLRWMPCETPRGEPLDALWSRNIERYQKWLYRRTQCAPTNSIQTASRANRPYFREHLSPGARRSREEQTPLPHIFPQSMTENGTTSLPDFTSYA